MVPMRHEVTVVPSTPDLRVAAIAFLIAFSMQMHLSNTGAMKNEISIRAYESADFRTVADLFEEFQDFLITLDPVHRLHQSDDLGRRYLEGMLKGLEKDVHLFEVATVDDQVVGFAVSNVRHTSPEDEIQVVPSMVGRLKELFVSGPHRDRGIGTKLLASAEEFFALHKCAIVFIEVFAPNSRARSFYERNGYKPRGIDLAKSTAPKV